MFKNHSSRLKMFWKIAHPQWWQRLFQALITSTFIGGSMLLLIAIIRAWNNCRTSQWRRDFSAYFQPIQAENMLKNLSSTVMSGSYFRPCSLAVLIHCLFLALTKHFYTMNKYVKKSLSKVCNVQVSRITLWSNWMKQLQCGVLMIHTGLSILVIWHYTVESLELKTLHTDIMKSYETQFIFVYSILTKLVDPKYINF